MASKKNTTALPADQQCAQQRTLDKHTRVENIFISTRSNNFHQFFIAESVQVTFTCLPNLASIKKRRNLHYFYSEETDILCVITHEIIVHMKPKTDATPTNAEIERQKNAFIEKLIEIVRKQEKPPKPETSKGQDQS